MNGMECEAALFTTIFKQVFTTESVETKQVPCSGHWALGTGLTGPLITF